MDRRASGIDTAWLQLERQNNRMAVHGILFCEGPLDVDRRYPRCQHVRSEVGPNGGHRRSNGWDVRVRMTTNT